jgi:hypothetical protein
MKLMNAVDEHIPEPIHDLAKSLRTPIQDVFSIKDHGILATGAQSQLLKITHIAIRLLARLLAYLLTYLPLHRSCKHTLVQEVLKLPRAASAVRGSMVHLAGVSLGVKVA